MTLLTRNDSLRIQLDLRNLSDITFQATSKTVDRCDALQEEVLHSLAVHDNSEDIIRPDIQSS